MTYFELSTRRGIRKSRKPLLIYPFNWVNKWEFVLGIFVKLMFYIFYPRLFIKVGISHLKKCFICFDDSHLKCFLFHIFFNESHLKSFRFILFFMLFYFFVLNLFFSLIFGHVEKTASLVRLSLISKSMKLQLDEQTITIHKSPNISRSKGNQTMKFGQVIKYNKRNIFLQ